MWTHIPLTHDTELSWIDVTEQNQPLLNQWIGHFASNRQDIKRLKRHLQYFTKVEMVLYAFVRQVISGPGEVYRSLSSKESQALKNINTPGIVNKNRVLMFALGLRFPNDGMPIYIIMDICYTLNFVTTLSIWNDIMLFITHLSTVGSAADKSYIFLNVTADEIVKRFTQMNTIDFEHPIAFRSNVPGLGADTIQILSMFTRSNTYELIGLAARNKMISNFQFDYKLDISDMENVMDYVNIQTLQSNQWVFEKINESQAIGYILFLGEKSFRMIDMWSMIFDRMITSCSEDFTHTFEYAMNTIHYSILFVGLFTIHASLSPENSIDSYNLPQTVKKRERFIEILHAVNAPVVNNLVCTAFLLGHIGILNLPSMMKMRLGFLDILTFGNCGKSDNIPLLLQHTENLTQQISQSDPFSNGIDKVVFSIIQAKPNQIDYILGATEYRLLENTTDILKCEVFGVKSDPSPFVDYRTKRMKYCQQSEYIMYKPLMEMELFEQEPSMVAANQWKYTPVSETYTLAHLRITSQNKQSIDEWILSSSRDDDECLLLKTDQIAYFAMLFDHTIEHDHDVRLPGSPMSMGYRVICQTMYLPVFYQKIGNEAKDIYNTVIINNPCYTKMVTQDEMPLIVTIFIHNLSLNKNGIVQFTGNTPNQRVIIQLLKSESQYRVTPLKNIVGRLFDSNYFNIIQNPTSIILQKLDIYFDENAYHPKGIGRLRKASIAAPLLEETEFEQIKWQYQQIDAQFTIGYLVMSKKLTQLQCSVIEMFVRKFSESCAYIASEVYDYCNGKSNSFLFVLLYQPPQIALEDRVENYRMVQGPLHNQFNVKLILEKTNAPILHGLVGLSFVIGTLNQLRPTKLNYGYFESNYVSRCSGAYNKYKDTIPAQIKVTAMLLRYAESIAREIGIVKLGFDEVPFAMLMSVKSAYFFYLKQAGYTKITEPNELLNCEAFGSQTIKVGVSLFDCKSDTLILMYKSLVDMQDTEMIPDE